MQPTHRIVGSWIRVGLVAALALALGACEELIVPTAPSQDQICTGYGPEETSANVLPYEIGASFLVIQGNCIGLSHFNALRFAYDFEMPIGTPIVAMRSGVVVRITESFEDGDRTTLGGNALTIDHGDGTYGGYAHLMHQGVVVEVGQLVSQGQRIAFSGDSGQVGGPPHLHLESVICNADFSRCETVPLTFRNASPSAPGGLATGEVYTALPF